MNVYMTIYRGETAEDEIEINIKGHYDKDDDSLEVLEVTATFDKQPVKLTPEERRKVGTVEFPEWLWQSSFAGTGEHTTFYWVENGATVVEVEEYDDEVQQCRPKCNCMNCTQARLGRPPFNESASSKIGRAQNIHAKGGNS